MIAAAAHWLEGAGALIIVTAALTRIITCVHGLRHVHRHHHIW